MDFVGDFRNLFNVVSYQFIDIIGDKSMGKLKIVNWVLAYLLEETINSGDIRSEIWWRNFAISQPRGVVRTVRR